METYYQCRTCGTLSNGIDWNQTTRRVIGESALQLPESYVENRSNMHDQHVGTQADASFVCPNCEYRTMPAFMIRVASGEVVSMECQKMIDVSTGAVSYNYRLFIADESGLPWPEDILWSFPDWTDDNMSESIEELKILMHPDNVLSFLRQRHPRAYAIAETKGLFLDGAWYHADNLRSKR